MSNPPVPPPTVNINSPFDADHPRNSVLQVTVEQIDNYCLDAASSVKDQVVTYYNDQIQTLKDSHTSELKTLSESHDATVQSKDDEIASLKLLNVNLRDQLKTYVTPKKARPVVIDLNKSVASTKTTSTNFTPAMVDSYRSIFELPLSTDFGLLQELTHQVYTGTGPTLDLCNRIYANTGVTLQVNQNSFRWNSPAPKAAPAPAPTPATNLVPAANTRTQQRTLAIAKYVNQYSAEFNLWVDEWLARNNEGKPLRTDQFFERKSLAEQGLASIKKRYRGDSGLKDDLFDQILERILYRLGLQNEPNVRNDCKAARWTRYGQFSWDPKGKPKVPH